MSQTFLEAAAERHDDSSSSPSAEGDGIPLRARCRGALLGLALGDALGTTLEFSTLDVVKANPLTDIRGGGPFNLLPGQWTDDTSLALCLAQSMIKCGGLSDPHDQLDTYLRWNDEAHLSSNGRRFDIGKATIAALEGWRSEHKICGTGSNRGSNGSLMRLAPAAIAALAKTDLKSAADMCASTSITTHDHPKANDACWYYGALLVRALRGAPKSELLAPYQVLIHAGGACTESPESHGADAHGSARRGLTREIGAVAAGSYLGASAPTDPEHRFGSAPSALNAALWAFANSTTFEAGALMVANLGGDADTTAAIYGMLAGAFYGEGALPAHWTARVWFHPLLVAAADALSAQASGGPSGAVEWWDALLDIHGRIESVYNRELVLRLAPITHPHGKAVWVPFSPPGPTGPGFVKGFRSVSAFEERVAELERSVREFGEARIAQVCAPGAPDEATRRAALDRLLDDWGKQWRQDAEGLGKALDRAPTHGALMAGIKGGAALKPRGDRDRAATRETVTSRES
jgi:ADP-ribosyl-[dinitrogen reductase] hydrolase